MTTKTFTIIVGDLVRSRDSFERQKLSHKIRLAINSLLKEFRDELYAPLVLTRGIDELAGVLKQPDLSYLICRLLNVKVSPHLFRFAIARGNLDIAVNSRDARKMDGQAFHMAADMIQQAKKENLYYCFNLGPQFAEFNPCLTAFANTLHILRSGRSNHQHLVVQLYEKFGNQKAVAERLGITQQAVSDALRQAHWKEIKRGEDLIGEVLKRHGSLKR